MRGNWYYKAMFATRYSNLRYELTEDDNYLRNATFDETMDGWTVQDDGKVITSNGEALLMNGNTYIADGRIAGIEHLDGRNVLHLKKSPTKGDQRDTHWKGRSQNITICR